MTVLFNKLCLCFSKILSKMCMLPYFNVWCMHKRWGVKSVMIVVMLVLIYFK